MTEKPVTKLRAERVLRGLTLQTVADNLGVRCATVHGWEKKKAKPTVDIAIKLAKMYGKTVEELFADFE